jgi:hypothetical protein
VHDDVGGLQEPERLDGEEIGIAGSGAYEIDAAAGRGGVSPRHGVKR